MVATLCHSNHSGGRGVVVASIESFNELVINVFASWRVIIKFEVTTLHIGIDATLLGNSIGENIVNRAFDGELLCTASNWSVVLTESGGNLLMDLTVSASVFVAKSFTNTVSAIFHICACDAVLASLGDMVVNNGILEGAVSASNLCIAHTANDWCTYCYAVVEAFIHIGFKLGTSDLVLHLASLHIIITDTTAIETLAVTTANHTGGCIGHISIFIIGNSLLKIEFAISTALFEPACKSVMRNIISTI